MYNASRRSQVRLNLLILSIAEKPRFLIRVLSPWRVRWEIFIIATAFYNIFFIPYDIAFIPYDTPALWYVDMIINAIYLLDIFVNFRTTYYNDDG